MCGKVGKCVGRLASVWEGRQVCGKVGKCVGRLAIFSEMRRRRHGDEMTSQRL